MNNSVSREEYGAAELLRSANNFVEIPICLFNLLLLSRIPQAE